MLASQHRINLVFPHLHSASSSILNQEKLSHDMDQELRQEGQKVSFLQIMKQQML